jgi:hypothetical protein
MPDNLETTRLESASLENRLQRLAGSVEHGSTSRPAGGPFFECVRRRARVRAAVRGLFVGGGVALAAAALLLAALLRAPTAPHAIPALPNRPLAALEPERPTIAELSRVSWTADGLGELPHPAGSGSPDEPLSAGAVHSERLAAELLGL